MIDLYKILPEEWFEQIGDFSDNEEKFAPIDYEPVTVSLYCGNSFYGAEFVDLLVDDDLQIYYISQQQDSLSGTTDGLRFGHGINQTCPNMKK